MDNNEIKKANRKALPKFMLIMVISLLIGGLGGFCSAKYGLNSLSDGMKSAGAFFSAYIAPWLMLAAAVILPVVCIPIYRSTKKLISSWDGENEENNIRQTGAESYAERDTAQEAKADNPVPAESPNKSEINRNVLQTDADIANAKPLGVADEPDKALLLALILLLQADSADEELLMSLLYIML